MVYLFINIFNTPCGSLPANRLPLTSSAFCSRLVATSCADILCNPPCAHAEAHAQALAPAKAGVTSARYCRWACPDENRDKGRKLRVYSKARLCSAGTPHCKRSEAKLISDMPMRVCSSVSIAKNPCACCTTHILLIKIFVFAFLIEVT